MKVIDPFLSVPPRYRESPTAGLHYGAECAGRNRAAMNVLDVFIPE